MIWSRRALESGTAETIADQHDSGLAEEAARVPRAIVLALKKAFGTRLIMIYAPPVGVDDVEPVETELRNVCAEQGVAFLSVQQALAQDRNEHSRLSRGFHNTAPGVGHFNAIGHQIIGEEIWRYLCARSSPSLQH